MHRSRPPELQSRARTNEFIRGGQATRFEVSEVNSSLPVNKEIRNERGNVL